VISKLFHTIFEKVLIDFGSEMGRRFAILRTAFTLPERKSQISGEALAPGSTLPVRRTEAPWSGSP
jgi:hypothetical protein